VEAVQRSGGETPRRIRTIFIFVLVNLTPREIV
jgi:hypothetical protein